MAFRPGRPPRRSQTLRHSGQASPEWLGLALMVALLMSGLSIPALPSAGGLAHSIYRSILCATSLAGGCPKPPSLEGAYGEELARVIRAHTPVIHLEDGVLGMPVDFRTCRSPACAEGEGLRRSGSLAGEPVTLFTRVIDCRGHGWDSGARGCGGSAAGNLYVQYWAYYPESATFRGIPILAERGHHPHDWESVQFRIGADGRVSQRASSHAGYVHERSVLNWPTDAGLAGPERALEASGLRRPGGWGPATGRWFIAGGSHAGAASADRGGHPVTVGRGQVRLVPLERVRSGPLARPARFDPITPPWEKRVWTHPEGAGTG